MKHHLFATVLAILTGLLALPAAAGPFIVSYQLSNVTFNDGGTAFGTISAVYNSNPFNDFSQLLSVDITTTVGSILAGTHYTNNAFGAGTASGSVPFGQSGPFLQLSFAQVSTLDQTNLLYLQYDQSVPVTPNGTLQLYGTDQIPGEWHNGTTRAIVSGSLVPVTVPEPATWIIFLAGLGLLFTPMRRHLMSAGR